MKDAEQTTNPIRLLMLGMDVKESLDRALALDPDNVQVRLDLVRFYVVAPRIVGGGLDAAREQAGEIAKRDAPLGAFARGYISYRQKEYGAARIALREAVRTAHDAPTKALAQKWLGWLSQETQQWDEAFAMFEALRVNDPAALYEIGRTSAFCACEPERGRAALEGYLRSKDRTHAEEAKKLLTRLPDATVAK
jgi:tetratricopeptide (TPR) repeat protein